MSDSFAELRETCNAFREGEMRALNALERERTSRLANEAELHRADAELGSLRSRIAALEAALTAHDANMAELVAKRDADLAALGREVGAWRGLAEWEAMPGKYRGVAFESRQRDADPYALGAADDGPDAFGHGDTPQAAAIDLAVKLGLLEP